ncbi:MAG: hypothetical protein KAU35_09935 [candidate division Zixibacteria bacterium]|nr:hypothetical protein [candidate division Zixibacteria bacterium]
MKNHISIRSLLGVMIALVMSVSCSKVSTAGFSADVTERQGDNTESGKIYVKGSSYCLEKVVSEEQGFVIVDTEAQKTVVINMATREYRESAIDDIMSIMNNPIQGYLYTATMGEVKTAGVETINGYECDKSTIIMGDTDVMSQWVAKSLDFPIRIVGHSSPERVFELTNIVEGSVDDSKFEIPEGFTKWIDPATLPVEPPAWAEGIPTAPVMIPPFQHDMSAGDIIRIKVEPGKSLVLKGVSKTDTKATARVIPFKDGRPLKEDTWYNSFPQEGTICVRAHETTVETDEFIVYVYEGDIALTTKWQEMLEKTVAEGEEIRLPLTIWEKIETRLVNLSDGESEAIFSYFEEGTELSEGIISPPKWRTVILKEKSEVHYGSRSYYGDEIVFSVKKGKMLIKLGQFDPFEF